MTMCSALIVYMKVEILLGLPSLITELEITFFWPSQLWHPGNSAEPVVSGLGPPLPPQAPLSPWSPKRCLAFHTPSLNKAFLRGRSALCLCICTVRHWSNPHNVVSIAVIAVSAYIGCSVCWAWHAQSSLWDTAPIHGLLFYAALADEDE